ncbi:MAG: hypothetical protein KDK45_11640, partial [Leptospiraceae bacterium]|nr:hypothetical protein [Leptospiraceae bacterium]
LFFAYYTGKEYEDRFRGALFGLLGYGNEGNRKYHRALPFYSYSSNEKSDSLSLYPLLYFSDNYESESDTYYSAINPLYYYKNTKSVNKD